MVFHSLPMRFVDRVIHYSTFAACWSVPDRGMDGFHTSHLMSPTLSSTRPRSRQRLLLFLYLLRHHMPSLRLPCRSICLSFPLVSITSSPYVSTITAARWPLCNQYQFTPPRNCPPHALSSTAAPRTHLRPTGSGSRLGPRVIAHGRPAASLRHTSLVGRPSDRARLIIDSGNDEQTSHAGR